MSQFNLNNEGLFDNEGNSSLYQIDFENEFLLKDDDAYQQAELFQSDYIMTRAESKPVYPQNDLKVPESLQTEEKYDKLSIVPKSTHAMTNCVAHIQKYAQNPLKISNWVSVFSETPNLQSCNLIGSDATNIQGDTEAQLSPAKVFQCDADVSEPTLSTQASLNSPVTKPQLTSEVYSRWGKKDDKRLFSYLKNELNLYNLSIRDLISISPSDPVFVQICSNLITVVRWKGKVNELTGRIKSIVTQQKFSFRDNAALKRVCKRMVKQFGHINIELVSFEFPGKLHESVDKEVRWI